MRGVWLAVTGLFGGRSFILLGFSPEDETLLQDLVMENGGKISHPYLTVTMGIR